MCLLAAGERRARRREKGRNDYKHRSTYYDGLVRTETDKDRRETADEPTTTERHWPEPGAILFLARHKTVKRHTGESSPNKKENKKKTERLTEHG